MQFISEIKSFLRKINGDFVWLTYSVSFWILFPKASKFIFVSKYANEHFSVSVFVSEIVRPVVISARVVTELVRS